MRVSKSILAVSASLFSLGYAADGVSFTNWPKEIQAGKPVTLTWAGGASDQVICFLDIPRMKLLTVFYS